MNIKDTKEKCLKSVRLRKLSVLAVNFSLHRGQCYCETCTFQTSVELQLVQSIDITRISSISAICSNLNMWSQNFDKTV